MFVCDIILQRTGRDRKVEGGSDIFATLDADAPTHQLDQFFTDRQPQSRTPIFAIQGWVKLREGGKQLMLLFSRDANSRIPYLKSKRDFLGPGPAQSLDTHRNAAYMREFDGIADEINKHLPQPQSVADDHIGNRGAVEAAG